MSTSPTKGVKYISDNRKARHDYFIHETYEAGIALTGTEVRSLRDNHCQLTDCFALIRNGEVWLNNVHISPYSNGSIFNPDPDRRRKLLLHKKQIRYLDAKVAEKGLAIVPLKMYFNEDGRVKVELALARLPTDVPVRVADLGTGTGAVALAIAAERPLADVSAVDASAAAIRAAMCASRARFSGPWGPSASSVADSRSPARPASRVIMIS